jgi:CheY-like chemotaxis protein
MANKKWRVIGIDDESLMLTLIEFILKSNGLEFTGATRAEQGLELVRRTKPDLVLLDLMLPDLDGWEVYQQLKADDDLKHIPVIVITAKVGALDRMIGQQVAHVDGYITKPFTAATLVQSIEHVLNAGR